jgi:acetyl-CoA C-acetyltransferase
MREAVIVAAARSPIGRAYKGSMTDVRADDLLAEIAGVALAQVPALDPATLDDLIVGCATPGGEQGFNLARVVAVLLGLDAVPGTTVTRYCASSVQAIRTAFHAIKAEEGHAFLCGGVETVSRYVNGNSDRWPDTKNPRFDDAGSRSDARSADGDPAPWASARTNGALPDIYVSMGLTAENVARARGITRELQDEFALRSQQRYQEALADGFWAREIHPITLPNGEVLAADESPRAGTSAEGLAGLAPAFQPEGSVTAGNSCPLNDGAAAVIVMSAERAQELGLEPLARIVSTGVSALDPEVMGLGPVEATRRALAIAGLTIDDLDLVEMNEAFAAQVIPSANELGIDVDKLNVHGGAIALGHPFGMTGARMTGTLLNGLRTVDGSLGLVTMCVGGGQGMALVVERLS